MKKLYYLIVLLFPLLVLGQSADQNYIKTMIYKKAVLATIPGTVPPVETADIQITYMDGLGRPIQQRAYRETHTGKDMVTHIEYDGLGRQSKNYLSYPNNSTPSLNYDPNAATAVKDYYTPSGVSFTNFEGTAYPYSETQYDNSPLNRVVKQSAPGDDWYMGSGHEIKMEYQANTAADGVKQFKANAQWVASYGIFTISMTELSSYGTGQLVKTVLKNENWTSGKDNTTEEFKNPKGQVVLKRAYESQVAHDTYYVYDQYGNLTYVLPPLAGGIVTPEILNNLCYQYGYDENNRLVEKKLPGKEWEFIVYDNLGRVVATGPALSPFGDESKGWLVTKYDAFDRVVLTGWMPVAFETLTRKNLQFSLNATVTNLNETKSTAVSTVNGVGFNYTNVAFPTSGCHVLSVNYYDDYAFAGAPSSFAATATADIYYNNSTQKPKGMPTGSWTRTLTGISQYDGETAYVLYDVKSRAVCNYSSNNFGKYTQVDTQYDFSGKPLKAITLHRRSTAMAEVKTTQTFEYTPQDRLLRHRHQVNNLPEEVLSENRYNELGQLWIKKVGGVVDNPLQVVDYGYTVRGWLKAINPDTSGPPPPPNDLFYLRLNYSTAEGDPAPAVQQYNGNIAQVSWKTASDGQWRKYHYRYDNLNRLLSANYQKNYDATSAYDEQLTYDKNGNIQSLLRNGGHDLQVGIAMDELVYGYSPNSNQLEKVTDNSQNAGGFYDGNTAGNDYEYDLKGNLTIDRNKGISKIYYNHLNLPTKILFGSESRKIEYFYNADGSKILKQVTDGATVTSTDYLDGYQYTNGVLQFFPTAQGYISHSVGNYNYVYNHTDHLGNVRVSYAKDPVSGLTKIVEESNYYPFGMKHANYNDYAPPAPGIANKGYQYKYNGQELQTELGLNLYDMPLRDYDPVIGRWSSMDPVVDFERSPYNGFDNNPVFWSDPSGASVTFYNNGVTADGEDAGAFYNAILGAQNNGIASFTPLGPIYDYTAYTTLPPVYLNYGNFGDNATMLRQHVYRNSPFYNYIWEQGRQRQLDSFNTMLDAFGLIPGIGEFADGLNVAIYTARGDKVNAAISAASMVPLLGWAAVSTKYAVKGGVQAAEYTFTKSAGKHLTEVVTKGANKGQLSRPYMNSSLTIQEIMSTGKGSIDATFKGGMNWKVPGTFRGSQGIWELGINPKTSVIYHFNFVK
ncbi:DUF6443 domain-containing protein [Flavobacterium kingsejongi]|uniref:DUF6443 domain-containing protein n=1 Tax=Flavobacterium kingsejongi TaxID=1678728 RepID=A0A2S1LRJ1_9FLAO|nr:DUF6443 domain-containing protein [Flavobacterium kingsejongi]AWG26256.1 hypothetical protein FK004_13965 [Flavobacterium kingsejongi]